MRDCHGSVTDFEGSRRKHSSMLKYQTPAEAGSFFDMLAIVEGMGTAYDGHTVGIQGHFAR